MLKYEDYKQTGSFDRLFPFLCAKADGNLDAIHWPSITSVPQGLCYYYEAHGAHFSAQYGTVDFERLITARASNA